MNIFVFCQTDFLLGAKYSIQYIMYWENYLQISHRLVDFFPVGYIYCSVIIIIIILIITLVSCTLPNVFQILDFIKNISYQWSSSIRTQYSTVGSHSTQISQKLHNNLKLRWAWHLVYGLIFFFFLIFHGIIELFSTYVSSIAFGISDDFHEFLIEFYPSYSCRPHRSTKYSLCLTQPRWL